MTDKDPRFDFERRETLLREQFAAKGDAELLDLLRAYEGHADRAKSTLEARIAGKVVAYARAEIRARTARRGA